jgi:hypothetical protein
MKYKIGTKIVVTNGCDTGAEGEVISKRLVPVNNYGIPMLDGHYTQMTSKDVAVIITVNRLKIDEKFNITGKTTQRIMDVYNENHIRAIKKG